MRHVSGPPRLRFGAVVFLVALLIYFITLNSVWATDHATSFIELDYSIWTNHTLTLGAVGSFTPNSVDIFSYKGFYYSALAPGAALFEVPFAGLGFTLDGGLSLWGNTMLLTEAFIAIMNAVAVYFLFRIARYYFSTKTSTLLAFAYGFSTVSWPFATFYFQNDVSAAFDLITLFLVLRATRDGGDGASLLLAGLANGAALTVDYINALLVPIILAYLALYHWKDSLGVAKRFLGFLMGSSVGVLTLALYNLSAFGSAFVTTEQLYLHSNTLFGNFSTPLYLGVILNSVTPVRGILLFSPVLALGILGFNRMLSRPEHQREGTLLLLAFLVLFLPYCAWYGPEGGSSYGPRFVIASLPFLVLPAGFMIEGSRRWWTAAYALYVVGAVVNGVGAVTSALSDETAWLSSPFLGSGLTALRQGLLDQWWRDSLGNAWPIGVGVVIGVAFVIPFLPSLLGVESAETASPHRSDTLREP